jgi:hypothetical protein
MTDIESRVSVLETKIENLNERLQLEECRWKPKVEVVLVWASDGGTMSHEGLMGVFSTQEFADAYIEREKVKDKTTFFRTEVVQLDKCLAPVVQ